MASTTTDQTRTGHEGVLTGGQASALQTSLYTSVMAFNVAKLVIGVGVAFIALGLGARP